MSDRRRFWEKEIARQERSGKSVAAYCESRDLAGPTFYIWRKRFREEGAPAPSGNSPFVEVATSSLERLASRSGIQIQAGGVVVAVERSFDAETLKLVLELVREGE